MFKRFGGLMAVCFCVGLVLSGAAFAVSDGMDVNEEQDLLANVNTASVTGEAPKAESPAKIETRDVQKALTHAGYFQGNVDGVMGPKTRKAIRAFQKDNGLKADGKCGPRTWTKLKDHLVEAVKTEDAIAKDLAATTATPAESGVSTLPTSNPKASQSSDLKQKLVS